MKEKTIVHLITGLGGGGAEQMVLKLALEAKELKIKTIIVAISSINTIEDKFKESQLEYYFLNVDSVPSVFQGLKKLKLMLKGEQEPILHCHMFHALIIGVLFKIFSRRSLSIVFTLHNNTVSQFYRAILLWLSKPFRAKDILFSKSGAQWFLKRKSVIIPNGLDISNFEVLKHNRLEQNSKTSIFHFLFLGSLTNQKNPCILPELASYLDANVQSDYIIDVVGQGPLMDELREKINSNGHENKIRLHGFSNKVTTFLKNSHCLIMPSHWEGMPVVILEAGAARLPIISTPVGSIPDIVSIENGYITELKDFPRTMKMVIENYDEAIIKADNFYQHVENNYSIKEVFKMHLDLYRSV